MPRRGPNRAAAPPAGLPPAGDPGARPWWRSKGGQLTEYLRRAIRDGQLAEPLPGMRRWCQQLGVGRRTLASAVRELHREGWLVVHRRGVRVARGRAGAEAGPRQGPRVVRLLLHGAYGPTIHGYLETISSLQEQLRVRGLEFQWELCPPARLREIARKPVAAPEVLVLASVPPAYQRLIAAAGRPAIVLGEVGPGIRLPFVNVDQPSAVRHATFRLLQRGCREIVLLHVHADAAGLRSARAALAAACGAWRPARVTPRAVPVALAPGPLRATVRRLAAGVRGRTGFIVLAPVPVGLVVTALWRAGVAVPAQAEVVALLHSPEAVKLEPPPAHYPSPVRQLVRHLTEAAVRYFDTGRLPAMAKTLPTELSGGD
ncbi:MAG: GntR family transcriptional regulator [Verrucomicrobia bacterium]|nr:GntR family transcriptional regulator [Verrucomicrobiota bacterium]